MLPSGPQATAEDRAQYWQALGPTRSHDTWSLGYGSPSRSSGHTGPLTVVPTGQQPTRPQEVVARPIGPLPNPLPSYPSGFVVPAGGFGQRSAASVLFNGPRHPGFRDWHPLVLARLANQVLGPSPPPGCILNTSMSGPEWVPAPVEPSTPTVTYLYPCSCNERSCRCTCLPFNRPCHCPYPRRF